MIKGYMREVTETLGKQVFLYRFRSLEARKSGLRAGCARNIDAENRMHPVIQQEGVVERDQRFCARRYSRKGFSIIPLRLVGKNGADSYIRPHFIPSIE